MQAAGALQRASEAQQARSEAARGGRAPSAMLEAELASAQQMAGVEQQKMLDQLSQQTAERKAATRQQLQMSALQSEAQAQAIDPTAQKRAAQAAGVGQAISTLGQGAFKLGTAVGVPTFKQQFQADQLDNLAQKVDAGAQIQADGTYSMDDLDQAQRAAARKFNIAYGIATQGNRFPPASPLLQQ